MKKNSLIVKAISIAVFSLSSLSYFSFGQEIKKFNVSLVVNSGPKKYLKQLDSVILRNEITREELIWDNLKTKDSIFILEDVDLSKYRIIVYENAMVIPFVEVAVCTSCRNKVNMTAYTSTANKVFDRVWIGPHYDKGFKQMNADFLSALTKDEVKTLKKTENKLKVKCFITANGKLSDIIFEQASLAPEIKALIRKGFEKTRNWVSGITNGKPFDDYISLSVDKIID